MSAIASSKAVTVTVNGVEYEREVEARKLLIHFVRDDLDLTGSHIGCDTGNCGACSMIVDGQLVKSCMLLAVQADGSGIETVERLAQDGELTALQQSFSDHHALQCGYCTPGMLISATALLRANPSPSDDESKKALQGNICRCSGYWNIFEAVKAAGSCRIRRRSRRTPSRSRRRRSSGRGRAFLARRTGGSSRARESSSTTSSGSGWGTSTSSARRTRMRTSP